MDKSIKLKISENKKVKGAISDFTISYSSKNPNNKSASNKIISALKGNENIIIEIDSSLMTLDEDKKNYLLGRLTAALERMSLNYIINKVYYDKKRSFLSVPIESKKVEGLEIYVFADDNIWGNEEFTDVIPEYGVRYYISGGFNDLETFTGEDEEERTNKCSMVIFDHIMLGSMGINTSKSLEELKSMLDKNML
ncbi:hypothetical protein [Clostridium sp. BNL1100]|uniref:hypothetical protein n=1 Tax=Clostridium sp. BNL1100 TaxID=755731 RepID=UPI00024A7133|nr:hypothetical protein [Clostridium sp. BNL1100]AEY65469.1 hypothetical protein Clo1100_1221 [Clostridium sp. BNL1100]